MTVEKYGIQRKFFTCYADGAEALAQSVMSEINATLEIDYVLWSHRVIGDKVLYYEQVVEPAIENADFVLFMLSKHMEEDELSNKVQLYCRNINKSVIPVKIDKGRLKLKKFEFRAKVYDFNDRSEKVAFMEQLHSWLGLVKFYPWSEVKFCSRCGKKIKTNAAFCKWCGKKFNN